MRLKIMCEDVLINSHSDGRRYHGWNNPFGLIIPMTGDIISLTEDISCDVDEIKNKEYRVVSRTFKACENYNNSYDEQECLLNVIKIK